ncbi:non-ribosomal peptide synthetase, partial [Bacillus cereus]|uniref:non-ribosomal peptide synthetase n=3 Tax=Bacillus cereus TaxID=1396 RepID=UPI000C01DABF
MEENFKNLSLSKKDLLKKKLQLLNNSLRKNTPKQIENTNLKENIPLSSAQKRLWFLYKFEKNTTSYNVLYTWIIKGNLNIPALEKSLKVILERHEILRTVFFERNGEPLQSVNNTFASLDFEDISYIEEDIEYTLDLAKSVNEEPFDLEKGPPIRFKLYKINKNKYLFAISLHHIVADGWSIGILFKELNKLYNKYLTKKSIDNVLEKMNLQYRDFAIYQNEELYNGKYDNQLSYWINKFEKPLPSIDLPYDKVKPDKQTYLGNVIEFEITDKVYNKIKSINQNYNTTTYMVLLSCFKLLLSKYSNTEDIIVGTPIANRNISDIENLIGFFVNTIAIRTNISNCFTFNDVLNKVKWNALEAYDNQDIPFEKIVQKVKPDRDFSQSPLFNVMFALQNAPYTDLNFKDLCIEPIEIYSQTSKFDLFLSATESNNTIKCLFEYNTDLFKESTIERIIQHYLNLLEQCLDNPDIQVSNICYLTNDELGVLTQEWNNTQIDYPKNAVHQMFEEQVQKNPNYIAVSHNGEKLTYRELNEKANKLAHYLTKKGVKNNQPVGLCLERSIDTIVSMLAILKTGGCYVPLDPSYPLERLKYMIEDSNAGLLITKEDLIKKYGLDKLNKLVIDVDLEKLEIEKQSNTNLCIEVPFDNLAYIIYTSGTTGRPKGV